MVTCQDPACSHEIRFSAEGWELHQGETVYSRKLYWGEVRGSAIRARYGVYSGFEASPITLELRPAKYDWRCSDCGSLIEKGDLHGGTFYDHFCLECVVVTRRTEFRETA